MYTTSPCPATHTPHPTPAHLRRHHPPPVPLERRLRGVAPPLALDDQRRPVLPDILDVPPGPPAPEGRLHRPRRRHRAQEARARLRGVGMDWVGLGWVNVLGRVMVMLGA